MTVKMLNKMDAKSRKMEDKNLRTGGTGRKGSVSDYHWGRAHEPHGTPQTWYTRGGVGDACMFREDITLVLVKGCRALENTTQAQLEALPAVQHDSNNVDDRCNHVAAIVRKDGSTMSFPIHTCSPALYA